MYKFNFHEGKLVCIIHENVVPRKVVSHSMVVIFHTVQHCSATIVIAVYCYSIGPVGMTIISTPVQVLS